VLLSVRHAGHAWRNGKSQPGATDFSAGQRPLWSKTAPTSRAVIEDYLKRSGLDITPAHEVDNITHAVSMIASTGAVALLPLYPNNLLPWSVTSRPIRGDAPTIDLVVGYNKANRSPILKLFLSRVDDLSARMSSHAR